MLPPSRRGEHSLSAALHVRRRRGHAFTLAFQRGSKWAPGADSLKVCPKPFSGKGCVSCYPQISEAKPLILRRCQPSESREAVEWLKSRHYSHAAPPGFI